MKASSVPWLDLCSNLLASPLQGYPIAPIAFLEDCPVRHCPDEDYIERIAVSEAPFS